MAPVLAFDAAKWVTFVFPWVKSFCIDYYSIPEAKVSCVRVREGEYCVSDTLVWEAFFYWFDPSSAV